ncbi:MAG TPA: hypothetical protein VNO83_09595, partial [Pseudonocardia sp.]|nr:hypothetical protein [Pseudonocardia sp.]
MASTLHAARSVEVLGARTPQPKHVSERQRVWRDDLVVEVLVSYSHTLQPLTGTNTAMEGFQDLGRS